VLRLITSLRFTRTFAGPHFAHRHRSNGAAERTFCVLHLLHFCTFLTNPHFDLNPDYIIRKPIKRRSNNLKYGNIVNFSHTSRIHFSANNTSFRPFKPTGLSAHRNIKQTDTQTHKSENSRPISLVDIKKYCSFLLAMEACTLQVTAVCRT